MRRKIYKGVFAMSKKNGGNRSFERRERNDLAKTCAFWGIVLAGVAMFIGFVISLLALLEITIGWAGTLRGICSIVSMVALLVAVAVPAYGYVRGRGKVWKAIYWVALVLYVCGIIGIGFTL